MHEVEQSRGRCIRTIGMDCGPGIYLRCALWPGLWANRRRDDVLGLPTSESISHLSPSSESTALERSQPHDFNGLQELNRIRASHEVQITSALRHCFRAYWL